MFVLSDDRRRSQSKKFRTSGPSSHHLGQSYGPSTYICTLITVCPIGTIYANLVL